MQGFWIQLLEREPVVTSFAILVVEIHVKANHCSCHNIEKMKKKKNNSCSRKKRQPPQGYKWAPGCHYLIRINADTSTAAKEASSSVGGDDASTTRTSATEHTFAVQRVSRGTRHTNRSENLHSSSCSVVVENR
jgi:hypothetical protein